jgi:hypothetical protein
MIQPQSSSCCTSIWPVTVSAWCCPETLLNSLAYLLGRSATFFTLWRTSGPEDCVCVQRSLWMWSHPYWACWWVCWEEGKNMPPAHLLQDMWICQQCQGIPSIGSITSNSRKPKLSPSNLIHCTVSSECWPWSYPIPTTWTGRMAWCWAGHGNLLFKPCERRKQPSHEDSQP